MSKFNSIVPVPLAEIRRLDGKITEALKPGILVTDVGNFAGGSSTHVQSNTPNSVFTKNADQNVVGVLIIMEQDELFAGAGTGKGVGGKISDAFVLGTSSGSAHVRAHVLKAGEDVTVILADSNTAIVAGDYLTPVANGKVAKHSSTLPKMFRAIEGCAQGATGDDLRILARVL